jgi:Transposase IS4
MRPWTNKRLISKGKKVVTKNEFRVYVGLELAMSIIQMNNMCSFWQSEMFTRHSNFRSTMSRNDFFCIWANLQLRDPDQHTNDQIQADPLWHSRKWLESFQKNSTAIAVPLGCSSFG